LKYIRTQTDAYPITEAIAADLAKYGDNERRMLYVADDFTHRIVDENQFQGPILRYPGA
jgi:hypothetical protein